MPRTVVYAFPAVHQTRVKTLSASTTESKNEPTSKDGFEGKLLKYIPAEVIAFYVSVYVMADRLGHTAKWGVLIAGLFGTGAYLFIRADKAKPPKWFFYVLAMVSFFAWAVGTSTVGADLFRWPSDTAEFMGKFILTAAVFLIPLTDELLTKLLPNAPTLPAPQPADS